MRRFIPLLFLLFALPTNALGARGGFYVYPDVNNPYNQDQFDCEVKQGVTLNPDGTLEVDDWRTRTYTNKGPFRFVASSGQMRFHDGDIIKWTILYPGGGGNSLVSHRVGSDPIYSIFRLEVWNYDGIGFTWTEGTSMWSGLCVRVD